ncbi:hypothetical protein KMW28_01925 [Flammeovirga yaeyamensis]|uniref:Uncharacterized protein n=1 Tax=Flammeovirga yaeyamensis TaxID=367791 RepID=A0AAX1N7G3_9BACT|nr:hypothetical protein [Flammeovirga yaeyamensis]MBB3699845.1 hypothetical protein [Flammeovirga yaeyamensis]NMF36586.1 hypothetical protein [Flammeovirga yaeyamensis]QWG02366.1 hypothetical protein KMW28_01925 [Flammeovirga yaeyamensis]
MLRNKLIWVVSIPLLTVINSYADNITTTDISQQEEYYFDHDINLTLDNVSGKKVIHMGNHSVATINELNSKGLHLEIFGDATFSGQNLSGENNYIGVTGRLSLKQDVVHVNGKSDSLVVLKEILSPEGGKVVFKFDVQNQQVATGFRYSLPKNFNKEKITFFPELKNSKKASNFKDITLPVEMVFLRYNKKENELEWQTATEINNDYFKIEYSDDRLHWNELNKVKGYGNTKVKKNYKYALGFEKHQFYRVVQTDFNKNCSIFNVEVPFQNDKELSIKVINGQVSVQGNYEKTNLSVFDQKGTIIFNGVIHQKDKIDVPKRQFLILQVQSGKDVLTKKLMIQS